MKIDWMLVATLAAPVLALFVGAAVNRYMERRVKLISFLAHASAVTVTPPNGNAFSVHTHTVVVRNAGKLPAHNVRLGHAVLPSSFSIYPPINHDVVHLPGGGSEIVLPIMVPGEQVTVAYLYAPPLTWEGTNRYAKCDEGFANIVTVLVTPRPPRWQRILQWALMGIGLVATLYVVAQVLLVASRYALGA